MEKELYSNANRNLKKEEKRYSTKNKKKEKEKIQNKQTNKKTSSVLKPSIEVVTLRVAFSSGSL